MLNNIEFRWYGNELQYRKQMPPPVITAGLMTQAPNMSQFFTNTSPVWSEWLSIPKVERPPEQLAFNWE